jgi:hypothetical protein
MTTGEAMEFRIWDSTNNRFFTMNVTISPNSNYTAGQLYFITSGTPTALTLQSLTSVTNMPAAALFITLLVMGAVGLFTAVTLRHRAAVCLRFSCQSLVGRRPLLFLTDNDRWRQYEPSARPFSFRAPPQALVLLDTQNSNYPNETVSFPTHTTHSTK